MSKGNLGLRLCESDSSTKNKNECETLSSVQKKIFFNVSVVYIYI